MEKSSQDCCLCMWHYDWSHCRSTGPEKRNMLWGTKWKSWGQLVPTFVCLPPDLRMWVTRRRCWSLCQSCTYTGPRTWGRESPVNKAAQNRGLTTHMSCQGAQCLPIPWKHGNGRLIFVFQLSLHIKNCRCQWILVNLASVCWHLTTSSHTHTHSPCSEVCCCCF